MAAVGRPGGPGGPAGPGSPGGPYGLKKTLYLGIYNSKVIKNCLYYCPEKLSVPQVQLLH